MTAPTPQQLQDLALDLQVELQKLEHLVEGLASLGPVAVDPLRVDAAALRLQSLYTGIERCLVQCLRAHCRLALGSSLRECGLLFVLQTQKHCVLLGPQLLQLCLFVRQ